jgi:hypothetical protein
MIKRIGDMRIQIDRWPLDDAGQRVDKAKHLLTVIIVAAFTEKPNDLTIANTCHDAAVLIKEGQK